MIRPIINPDTTGFTARTAEALRALAGLVMVVRIFVLFVTGSQGAEILRPHLRLLMRGFN